MTLIEAIEYAISMSQTSKRVHCVIPYGDNYDVVDLKDSTNPTMVMNSAVFVTRTQSTQEIEIPLEFEQKFSREYDRMFANREERKSW